MGRATRVSVIIPTYNRSALLRRTLDSLVAQQFPPDDFEVVVADDGSTDDTASVVRSYAGRLRTRYHFQQDLGFRVATARNAGARLATAPVLVFLDTGALASFDFLRAHVQAHRRHGAVMGYTHSFAHFRPQLTPDEGIARLPANAIHQRLADDRRFRDARHYILSMVDFDMSRLVVPWWVYYSANISVRATDFWSVGGYDEEFRSWGAEDVEFGYRLYARGVPLGLSRAAWTVELPHYRSPDNPDSSLRNTQLMLDKHPEPMMEMCVFISFSQPDTSVEPVCQALRDCVRQVSGMQVEAELAAVVGPGTRRVAVLGSGGVVPASWATDGTAYTLIDFDRDLLTAAAARGPFATRHAIGLRTDLADHAFDLVVISSRLAGLWPLWGEHLLAEAHRIGRAVRLTDQLRARAAAAAG